MPITNDSKETRFNIGIETNAYWERGIYQMAITKCWITMERWRSKLLLLHLYESSLTHGSITITPWHTAPNTKHDGSISRGDRPAAVDWYIFFPLLSYVASLPPLVINSLSSIPTTLLACLYCSSRKTIYLKPASFLQSRGAPRLIHLLRCFICMTGF